MPITSSITLCVGNNWHTACRLQLHSVISTLPGVEVKTVRAGDGATRPKVGETLRMHYTGTLKEGGKQFDT